jgi:hypothetical protein
VILTGFSPFWSGSSSSRTLHGDGRSAEQEWLFGLVPDRLAVFRCTDRKPTRQFDNLQPVSRDPYSSKSEQQFQSLKGCSLVGARLFVVVFRLYIILSSS